MYATGLNVDSDAQDALHFHQDLVPRQVFEAGRFDVDAIAAGRRICLCCALVPGSSNCRLVYNDARSTGIAPVLFFGCAPNRCLLQPGQGSAIRRGRPRYAFHVQSLPIDGAGDRRLQAPGLGAGL